MDGNQDVSPLIMVVDDQWINRELMETILKGYGFRVILANSGAEALRLLAESPPDLILLDLRMPNMDGAEVSRRIKNDEMFASIPVVIMTAWELTDQERRQIEAASADAVISRVIPAPQLIETIYRHLEQRA